MVHPSVRSLVIAGSGLVLALLPLFVSHSLWMLWVSFWICMVLFHSVDLALVLGTRLRDLTLDLPSMVPVGSPTEVNLEITISTTRPLSARAKLDTSPLLEPVPVARLRFADGRAAAFLRIVPRRRGDVELEALTLRYAGPLGLVRRTRRLPLARTSTAVPDTAPVKAAALRFHSAREFRSGLKIERYIADGTEFESLREFQPGHDTRAMDWKSSARHTKLLVRRFRAERNHQIVVAMDSGRLMAEPVEGMPKLDHAIHAGLLMAYMSMKAGDRVGFYAFDSRPRVHVQPQSGVRAFPVLLKAAGGLTYSMEETNFTVGLTDLSTRLNRRSLVVTITDFVDSVTAELMIENLHRLARRHLTIFVALQDPVLGRIVTGAPVSLEAINRAVVAHSLVREREKVLLRLRRAGILCIEAPPHRVGIDLVNRYLNIKRRELI